MFVAASVLPAVVAFRRRCIMSGRMMALSELRSPVGRPVHCATRISRASWLGPRLDLPAELPRALPASCCPRWSARAAQWPQPPWNRRDGSIGVANDAFGAGTPRQSLAAQSCGKRGGGAITLGREETAGAPTGALCPVSSLTAMSEGVWGLMATHATAMTPKATAMGNS